MECGYAGSVIASPRRQEILRLVWTGNTARETIHRAMPDVTFGAVSLQLRALTKAGLVRARAEGRSGSIRRSRRRCGPVGSGSQSACGTMHSGGSSSPPSWNRPAAARGRDADRPRRDAGGNHDDRRPAPHAASTRSHRHDPGAARDRVPVLSPTPSAGPSGGAPARPSMRNPAESVYVRHPGGVESRGKVIEIDAPKRFVFTYGFVSGQADSRRQLTRDDPARTASRRARGSRSRTSCRTRLPATSTCRAGAFSSRCSPTSWRTRSRRMPSAYIDMWFDAWAEPDAIARRKMLAEVVRARGAHAGSLQQPRRHRRPPAAHRRVAAVHARLAHCVAPATCATVRGWCSPTGR